MFEFDGKPNHDGASHPAPSCLADRLPPQNLEAEAAVIGGALLDAAMLDEVLAFLTPGDFYRDAHAAAFEALAALREANLPVDCIHLADELTRRGVYGRVGGDELLASCVNSVPHAVSTAYYGQIVKQKAHGRRLIEAANGILRDAYSGNFTAEQLMSSAEEAVFAACDAGSPSKDPVHVAAGLGKVFDAVDRRAAGEAPGIDTGFADLDYLTDGLHAGRFYVLAARPSVGKTALALNVCARAAAVHPVLFFSLEMSEEEVWERYLCGASGVFGDKLKAPERLTDYDRAAFGRASELAARSFLYVDDTPGLGVAQIAASARRQKARRGLGLLCVDYLQLVEGQHRKGESRQEEVARVSRRLKSLAKELGCPVLATCQLNRASEQRDEKRPRLADLRESGQIEQDAHVVMLLHRPELYDPADRPGEADLVVAKNRSGATGTVRLRFRRETTRFERCAADAAPENGQAPY